MIRYNIVRHKGSGVHIDYELTDDEDVSCKQKEALVINDSKLRRR